MIYVKSLVAGLVTACAATMIYLLAQVASFILLPWLTARLGGAGSGGGGVVVGLGSVFIVALIAFGVGAYWRFRKG